MTPQTSISTLANAAESALNTYNSDQNTVAADAAKMQALQQQLVSDQNTATADGQAAYAALLALDQAIQAQLATLPQPAPAATPALPSTAPTDTAQSGN